MIKLWNYWGWLTRSCKVVKNCNNSSMIKPVSSSNWIPSFKHKMGNAPMLRICKSYLKKSSKNQMTRTWHPCWETMAKHRPFNIRCWPSVWLVNQIYQRGSFSSASCPLSTCFQSKSDNCAATVSASSKRSLPRRDLSSRWRGLTGSLFLIHQPAQTENIPSMLASSSCEALFIRI